MELEGSAYLVQHAVQLIPRLADTVAIVAVDHEDEALHSTGSSEYQKRDMQTNMDSHDVAHHALSAMHEGQSLPTAAAAEQSACSSGRTGAHLCVLEIVTPQRADLVLTSHIPHREADVLVLDSLHIEACAKTFRPEFYLRPR